MSIPEGIKMAASHPGHPVLSADQLLKLTSDIGQAIERCGASVELTNAVTLATDMYFHLRRYLATPAQPQPAAHLTIPGALEWDGDNGTHSADGESRGHGESEPVAQVVTHRSRDMAKVSVQNVKLLRSVPDGTMLYEQADPAEVKRLRAQLECSQGDMRQANKIMARQRVELDNLEQSRRSFFDLSQDLEKRLAERDALLHEAMPTLDLAAEAFKSAKPVRAKVRAALSIIARPKTCIECDQPHCHGVCVERGDEHYDRDQAQKGGDDE